MKLIYVNSGTLVQFGDIVNLSNGEKAEVTYFRAPHKAASSGKVSVKPVGKGFEKEFFVGVIGAEWVDRPESS